MTTCPYCGTENEPDAKVCINCSADLTVDPAQAGAATVVEGSQSPQMAESPPDLEGQGEELPPEESVAETIVSSAAGAAADAILEEPESFEESAAPESSEEELDIGTPEPSAAETVVSFGIPDPAGIPEIEETPEKASPPPEEDEPEIATAAELEEEPTHPSAFERAEQLRQTPPRVEVPASPLPAAPADKNRSLAVGLEFGGLVGFLGIGWLYAGNTLAGVLAMLGYWVWNIVAIGLDILTFGIFLCIHIPVSLAATGISAFLLYRYTEDHPDEFV